MSQGCMIEGCQRKHHTLLHRASSSPKTEVAKDEKVSFSERVEATVKSHVGVLNGIVKADSENKMRLLPTAKAKSIQNGTETDFRILIDSGSDHSYIKQDIADSLGMQSEGPSKLMTIYMHGGQSRTIKARNFKFTLTGLDGSKSADVSAWAVDKVCTPLEAVPVDISKYRYLKGLKLADSYPRQTANIDILLGSDQWGQILRSGLKKRDASSPIATNSIFGWMISGNEDVGSEYLPNNRAMTNCATKRERVTAQSLRYLYDTLVNRYHTLEQYEPNLEVCHRILVPIFQNKLPNDIRRKWEYEFSKLENEEEDKRVTAEFFFDFLRSHVMSEEAIEKSTPNRSTHPRMSHRPRIQNKDQGDSRFSSATALAAQSSQETVRQGRSNQSKCGFL
eukprot:Seg7999.2 transcript_id=Seg7999.2/GoldUCD/mRNA.D3Y31 product="hypothetical protein" protein_id=Seg7999.2/GoldUCD/D3Y31